jgi:hypothetical protein
MGDEEACWEFVVGGRIAGLVRYVDSSANLRVFLLTVELPLPTHMRCQSLADQTSLLAQEEILLDLTAPHLLRARHA